jgi:hypothetical protein
MNERICELAAQSGMIYYSKTKALDNANDGMTVIPSLDGLEKFAELIVQECITTILKESKWYWDKDEFESANAVQNAARRVKEHFGVEE